MRNKAFLSTVWSGMERAMLSNMSEEPNAEKVTRLFKKVMRFSVAEPKVAFMMPHPSCSQHLTNDLIGH